jgi:hypothetical protein
MHPHQIQHIVATVQPALQRRHAVLPCNRVKKQWVLNEELRAAILQLPGESDLH